VTRPPAFTDEELTGCGCLAVVLFLAYLAVRALWNLAHLNTGPAGTTWP
jgi:hypothetical protein